MTSPLGDVDEESLKTIHWTHQPQLLSISHLTSDLHQFDIVARSDKVAIQLDGDNLTSALDKLQVLLGVHNLLSLLQLSFT